MDNWHKKCSQGIAVCVLLEPNERMKKLQNEADFASLMVIHEELKAMPFGDVWDECLKRTNTPADYLAEVNKYEKEVLEQRK